MEGTPSLMGLNVDSIIHRGNQNFGGNQSYIAMFRRRIKYAWLLLIGASELDMDDSVVNQRQKLAKIDDQYCSRKRKQLFKLSKMKNR